MKLNEIKEIFEQNKDAIAQLMKKYHVTSIGVFGPEIGGHPFALNKKINLLISYDTMSTSDFNMFRKELRALIKCFLLEVYTETALKTLAEQQVITAEMNQNAISSTVDLLCLHEKKSSTKLSADELRQDPSSFASSSTFFSSQQSIENSLKPHSASELEEQLNYHMQQVLILTNEIAKSNPESAKELSIRLNETFTKLITTMWPGNSMHL
jgi:predicted nucleotidyltransferase